MFKKIVGFGDSWMYGDELLDPKYLKQNPKAHPTDTDNTDYRESNCFLGLLGEHYGVPTENFGIPGGSLQSSIWTFLWWYENETEFDLSECLILVGHTDSDRASFYNPDHVVCSDDPPWNRFAHSSWVEYGFMGISEEMREMAKIYTVLTDSPKMRRLNYMQTALFFDGVASSHDLQLHQFHIMPREVELDLPSVIWNGEDTVTWFRDHPGNQKRELIKAVGHPNEIGHEMIKNRLISTIEK